MSEERQEQGKSWWKYALGAYAAKTALDSEVDSRVNKRLREIKEGLQQDQEQQRLNSKLTEMGKTAKGKKFVAQVKNALKTVEEGPEKVQELEDERERLENQVRLLENRVEHKKKVSITKAVWLDILSVGGAKHLYLQTGIRLKRLKTDQGKKFLLTDNKNLLRNWLLKLLWVAILIIALFAEQTATQDDKTGLAMWIIATIATSSYLTYVTARELNDNLENHERNRKELAKSKKEMSSKEREYKTLETTVTGAQNFLEETYAALKS